jgi:hypothetical protein
VTYPQPIHAIIHSGASGFRALFDHLIDENLQATVRLASSEQRPVIS